MFSTNWVTEQLMCPLPNDSFALFISGYNRKQKISLFRCRCGKVDIVLYVTIHLPWLPEVLIYSALFSLVFNLWNQGTIHLEILQLTIYEYFVFYRVDFVKYPGLAKVEYHYVEMQPGDCLYIPYGWYGDDIAISCSYPCGLDVVWLRFTGVITLWFNGL